MTQCWLSHGNIGLAMRQCCIRGEQLLGSHFKLLVLKFSLDDQTWVGHEVQVEELSVDIVGWHSFTWSCRL